jgi:peptidoglycan/LPS O-acetylase OafA/YrhL
MVSREVGPGPSPVPGQAGRVGAARPVAAPLGARQTAHMGERRAWHDRTRLPALDGLRGLAILLVLVHHVRSVFVPHLHPSLVSGGFLGVDLFFVLSGFLITGLLLDEFRARQGVSLPSFYRRRVMRLYPALVVLLVAHAIYATRVGIPFDVEREHLVSVLFYYSNWRETLSIPEGTGHLWSLAVEEQFYLLWPLVLLGLLWLTNARRSYIGPIIAAGVASIALYRAWQWHDGMVLLFVYVRTDMRADALLIGALAAVLVGGVRGPSPSFTRGRWFQWAAWVATGALACSVLFARVEKPLLYLGGFTVVAVACAVLALAVLPNSGWPGARAMHWGPLRVLGIVSYGAYLWHLPVFTATQRYLADVPVAGRAVIGCAITAILTSLSWFLVERPVLRWKRRLDRRAPRPISVRSGGLGTPDMAMEPGIDQHPPDRTAAHRAAGTPDDHARRDARSLR